MDQEQLLGSVFRKEVKARQVQEKRAAQAAIKATREQQVRNAEKAATERRQGAFESLGKRNTAVIDEVRAFTKGGAVWNVDSKGGYANRIRKQGKVVILAPAPKSKVTPDHVAVCLVSSLEVWDPDYVYNMKADRKAAQFRFAFAPRNRLDKVVGEVDRYPFSSIPADELVCRDEDTYYDQYSRYGGGDESSLSSRGRSLNSGYTTSRIKRAAYKVGLRECTATIEAVEHDLEWVLQAASDTDLNPHLRFQAGGVHAERSAT